jgi:hypothetical protein
MPLSAEQRASLDHFFTDATFEIQRNGESRSEPTPEERLNRDLRPRDEYFVNDR